MEISYRKAERCDAPLILWFIKQIAAYEKLSGEVSATEELIDEWVFEKGCAEVIFVLADGKEVGFALYFYNFSTFTGRGGLYLEDLFVMPEYRGLGLGKGLFCRLAEIAERKGCGRMEWVCLDWNQPSIDFYRSMGATPMFDWTLYRLRRDQLNGVAQKGRPSEV